MGRKRGKKSKKESKSKKRENRKKVKRTAIVIAEEKKAPEGPDPDPEVTILDLFCHPQFSVITSRKALAFYNLSLHF